MPEESEPVVDVLASKEPGPEFGIIEEAIVLEELLLFPSQNLRRLYQTTKS